MINIRNGSATLQAWDIGNMEGRHAEGVCIVVEVPPSSERESYEFVLTLDDMAKLVRAEGTVEVVPEHTVTTFTLRGARQK